MRISDWSSDVCSSDLPEEKAERFQLMQQHGISELDAAFRVAEKIDRARGIEPLEVGTLACRERHDANAFIRPPSSLDRAAERGVDWACLVEAAARAVASCEGRRIGKAGGSSGRSRW